MEELYLGTKIIAAEPMDERKFLLTIKHQPEIDAPHSIRSGYKVRYEDGYVSWSPKETFERAYRKITQAERDIIEGPLHA